MWLFLDCMALYRPNSSERSWTYSYWTRPIRSWLWSCHCWFNYGERGAGASGSYMPSHGWALHIILHYFLAHAPSNSFPGSYCEKQLDSMRESRFSRGVCARKIYRRLVAIECRMIKQLSLHYLQSPDRWMVHYLLRIKFTKLTYLHRNYL